MFCASCKRYLKAEMAAAPARGCEVCGGPASERTPQELGEDLGRLRYLVDELAQWASTGLIDEALRARLMAPYQLQVQVVERYLWGAPEPGAKAEPGAGWGSESVT